MAKLMLLYNSNSLTKYTYVIAAILFPIYLPCKGNNTVISNSYVCTRITTVFTLCSICIRICVYNGNRLYLSKPDFEFVFQVRSRSLPLRKDVMYVMVSLIGEIIDSTGKRRTLCLILVYKTSFHNSDCHYKFKTVIRLCYLYNWNPYNIEMAF